MWRRRKDNLKRRMMSGILACLLVATSLTNTVGIITSFAGQTANIPRVSYKYDDLKNDKGQLDKMVQINVQAENESFAPGSEMVLKVYVQNLSDQNLTGGSLKWSGKGLEEAGFLDEEEEDLFNGPGWNEEDSDSNSDTSDLMEDLGSFGVTGLRKSAALKIDDTAAKNDTEAPEQNVEIITDTETEEEEDDTSDPQTDEEGKRIRGIELAPGEVYETRFYGTVEDMDSIVTRKVTFEFLAGTDDNTVAQDKAEFTYNTGMALVLPIEFDDGPALMTNELNTMYIHTRFEDEKILDEYTWEITDEDEATPSDAERHEITVATMSNGTEDSSEGTTPANMKYSIVTYGAKLEGIEAWYDDERSGWGEMATGVSFRVKDDTEPGVYFGQVTTSIRREGKSYKTTQGFHFFVLGDGQMVLKGNINGAEIQVKGDRSSFPEGDMLSLKVTEVPAEKMDLVQEAMAQKAEELGVSVDKMKAMDIKVIADGVEQELEGEVEVTFSNLTLEKVEETIGLEGEEDTEDGEVEELEEVNTNVVFGLRKAGAGTEEEQADAAGEAEIAEAENESEGEEKEESTLAVWHLDEDAGIMNEMDSEVNDDGDVVMATEHFSIFIIVNLPNNQKSVQVTLSHWAKVKVPIVINGTDGVPKNLSEQVKVVDNPGKIEEYLLPGAGEDNQYNEQRIQIYSQDILEIPNGGGTGVGFSISVEDLSKLVKTGNYTITGVKVNGVSYTAEQLNSSEVETVPLRASNNTIEFDYEKTTGSIRSDVEFHDYNISESGKDIADKGETTPGNDITIHHTVNTQDKGINSSNLCTDNSNRIGVGIKWTTKNNKDAAVWHSWGGAGGIVASRGNLVEENLSDDGMLRFKLSDPGLFVRHDIRVKNKIAKKYITDHQLGFKREGDHYTLQAVYQNGNSEPVLDNLDVLRYTGKRWSADGNGPHMYTNLFWPLDSYTDGDYKPGSNGMDPKFPGDRRSGDLAHGTSGFPLNDESQIGDYTSHNWFYGMRYDFEFVLGDYIGPLDYYFRGDDDFWLFIDGELVSDVELGGIHQAQGAYVDLKAYLRDKLPQENDTPQEIENKKKAVHKMTVFYMERGGTGSCCYMSFTLPNLTSVPSTDADTITKTVTKIWKDNESNHKSVFVQLLQNEEPFGKLVELSDENGWSYTWDPLPKYTYVGSNIENRYTIKEITVPGYESIVDQETFTITNIETAYIAVEKQWNNEEWKDTDREPDTAMPPSIEVQLEKSIKGINNWQAVGEPVELKANSNASLNWKYGWQNMPLWEKINGEYEELEYRVREVDGYWLKTDQREDGWYEVSYKEDHPENHFIIENIYKPSVVSKEVEKIWVDENNKFEKQPLTGIQVELKQKMFPSDSGKIYARETLRPDKLSHKWDDLPKYYYEMVGGKVEQKPYIYEVWEVEDSNPNKAYYTTAHSSQTEDKVTITNTLKTAKFRVAKSIDNYVDETGRIVLKDLQDDEFIVKVEEQVSSSATDKAFSTGLVLKHAGVSPEEIKDSPEVSGYIELPVTDIGTLYKVTEIVPKEYTPSETDFLTTIALDETGNIIGSDKEKVVKEEPIGVRIYPDADVIVVVHNNFGHKDYFHHDVSVTNLFNTGQRPPVKSETFNLVVSMNAFLPEEMGKDWERKHQDEERLM